MEDEDLIYKLLEEIQRTEVRRTDLDTQGFLDWNAAEMQTLLKALLTANILSEEGGVLKWGEKGRFFWKRVRRKKQGFV